MPPLKHFRHLFLWVHLLTLVQCTTQTCTLESFTSNPELYDDNFETSNLATSYDSGKTVRVPCKVGYRGFYKIICNNEGKWYSITPNNEGGKCKPIPCGHPGDVPFADFALIKLTDYVFGAQVQYTCHSGYQMVSLTSTRNCLQRGWDGHLPVCEPVQCPSMTVDDNVMVIGDLEQPQSGSVVQFRCFSNDHELIGPAQIICGDNGEWNNDIRPTCRPITCTNPPLENFVVVGDKTEYKKDDVLRYKCNRGYKKSDGRPSLCLKFGQSAKWAPEARCEPITCKVSSKTLTGTSYSPRHKTIFSIDENVTVSCADKLWVKNKGLISAELTCLETGEWDSHPVCQLVTCDKYDQNVYWWERAKWDPRSQSYRNTVYIDETVQYRCRGGFEETNPSRRATCTRQGWDPNPLCTEGSCPKPSYRNAQVYYQPEKNKYRHEEWVYLECTHDRRVQFHVQCLLGVWEGSPPSCREKPCTTEPNIEHGEIPNYERRPYEHGETLSFRCHGETDILQVTCKSGEWRAQRSCQDASCRRPNIPNGELTDQQKQSFKHGETVQIRCTTGSEKSFTIGCQSGEWIQKEECPDASCRRPNILNGELTDQQKRSFKHGETVEIRCTTGSEKNFTIDCQSGEWIQKEECPESPCGNPQINNGFAVQHKDKVYYTCDEDFKLVKGWWAEASCVDTKWSTSECIAKSDCGPVPDIPHLRTSSDKSFHDKENFNISCEKGYQARLDVLTCNNGTWDRKNVKRNQICTPKEKMCKTPPKIKNAVVKAPFEKEYFSNTELTYKCRDASFIDASATEATIRCNNGTWVPPPETISCQEISTTVNPEIY